jgi:hypothetical protein
LNAGSPAYIPANHLLEFAADFTLFGAQQAGTKCSTCSKAIRQIDLTGLSFRRGANVLASSDPRLEGYRQFTSVEPRVKKLDGELSLRLTCDNQDLWNKEVDSASGVRPLNFAPG